MQAQDIILVNVAGTNGTTRNQKFAQYRFNGNGEQIDAQGTPLYGKPGLGSLVASTAPIPQIPQAAMAEAQAKGDAAAIGQILLTYGAELKKWQDAQGSGTPELRIGKAVIAFLVKHDQFSEVDDATRFVLKLENLDISQTELKAGNTLWQVGGTAVFGR